MKRIGMSAEEALAQAMDQESADPSAPRAVIARALDAIEWQDPSSVLESLQECVTCLREQADTIARLTLEREALKVQLEETKRHAVAADALAHSHPGPDDD